MGLRDPGRFGPRDVPFGSSLLEDVEPSLYSFRTNSCPEYTSAFCPEVHQRFLARREICRRGELYELGTRISVCERRPIRDLGTSRRDVSRHADGVTNEQGARGQSNVANRLCLGVALTKRLDYRGRNFRSFSAIEAAEQDPIALYRLGRHDEEWGLTAVPPCGAVVRDRSREDLGIVARCLKGLARTAQAHEDDNGYHAS